MMTKGSPCSRAAAIETIFDCPTSAVPLATAAATAAPLLVDGVIVTSTPAFLKKPFACAMKGWAPESIGSAITRITPGACALAVPLNIATAEVPRTTARRRQPVETAANIVIILRSAKRTRFPSRKKPLFAEESPHMLSRADNERLTRVGPGTPMGELMRRYWIPVEFSHQLPKPDGPPLRVRLLCEDLVLFRDTQGRIGLLDERCPHRTASLFFGRNEECGLRCVYHGWKFDIEGNCTDLPSEPWDKDFKRKIKITAYPCIERGGLVWAYMGPPEHKPPFPEIEWTLVPASHRYVTRHVQECNWLQALEGGFDVSHLSFLHQGTADGPDGRPIPIPTRYEVVPADCGLI